MRGVDLLKDIGYIDDALVQEAAIDMSSEKVIKIHNWSKWTRWGSVAAGFVVLCVAAVALRQGARSYDATESVCTADNKAAVYSVEDSVAEYVMEEAIKQETGKTSGSSADATMKDTATSASTTEAKYDIVQEEAQELQIIKEYSREKEVDGEIADLEGEVCYALPEKGEYFYFYELEEAMKAYAGQAVQYYVTIDVFRDGEQLALEVIYGGDGGYDKNSLVMKEYERLLAEGYEVIIEEKELRGYFTEEELKTFVVNPQYGYAFHFAEDF